MGFCQLRVVKGEVRKHTLERVDSILAEVDAWCEVADEEADGGPAKRVCSSSINASEQSASNGSTANGPTLQNPRELRIAVGHSRVALVEGIND